jgi:hypothetical protein
MLATVGENANPGDEFGGDIDGIGDADLMHGCGLAQRAASVYTASAEVMTRRPPKLEFPGVLSSCAISDRIPVTMIKVVTINGQIMF